ncbi:MAG: hypothetical protein H6510_09700 [Acidobacteria bacterium]|nr:hypothetical protein [Acidobacteriota bacterium]MCB9398080.1 hypothetical protein [Acidobacteriota bacterium]
MFCFTLISLFLGLRLGGDENPFEKAELAIDSGKFEQAAKWIEMVGAAPASPLRDCQLAYLEASQFFRKGDANQALTRLASAESQFTAIQDPHLKAKLYHRYGYLLLVAGRAAPAEIQLKKALEIKAALKDPISQVKTLHTLSDCAHQLGQIENVLKYSQQALDLVAQKFGKAHAETGFERGFMMEAYLLANQPKEAEKLVSENRDLMNTDPIKKDPRYADYLRQIARVATKNGNFASAFFVLDDAQALEKQAFGEKDMKRIPTLLQQGDLAFLMEESWRGEGLFREVITILESNQQGNSPDMARALYGLGMIYKEWNNLAESKAMFSRAQPIAQKYKQKFPSLVMEIEKEMAAFKPAP